MKTTKTILVLFLCVFFLFSCKKEIKQVKVKVIKETNKTKQDSIPDKYGLITAFNNYNKINGISKTKQEITNPFKIAEETPFIVTHKHCTSDEEFDIYGKFTGKLDPSKKYYNLESFKFKIEYKENNPIREKYFELKNVTLGKSKNLEESTLIIKLDVIEVDKPTSKIVTMKLNNSSAKLKIGDLIDMQPTLYTEATSSRNPSIFQTQDCANFLEKESKKLLPYIKLEDQENFLKPYYRAFRHCSSRIK